MSSGWNAVARRLPCRAATTSPLASVASQREVATLEAALARAEGDDFPVEAYGEVRGMLTSLARFCDEEGSRLQEKILHTGGLEPGRIRRTGG